MGRPPKIYDRHKPYGSRKTRLSQLVYILGAILWVLIILWWNLCPPNWLGWLILLLPLVVFMIGFLNVREATIELEEDMFKADHLSLGLIVVLSLFAWMSRDYCGDARAFVGIVLLAISFSFLGVIDIWVTKKWLSVVKHVKSVLQTLAISLLLYALYLYYNYRTGQALPE